MSEFKAAVAGETEAQWRQFLSYLFAQGSTGSATSGVLSGLAVTQTTTASAAVLVDIGLALSQSSLTAGVSPLLNNAQKTLDVLTANPMGATPRNDLVVFDPADSTIKLVVGTPNAVPTDPTAPTGSVALARLAHLASATTVPAARITDLRTITYPFGGPYPKASATKAGKRIHWGSVSTSQSGGSATITHGAGFTPSVVHVTPSIAWMAAVTAISSTTFTVAMRDDAGVAPTTAVTVYYACYE